MKKILITLMAFALTTVAKAEKIDSTQFVAFYNYTLQTQDDEGQNVVDSLRLALLVGTHATECQTLLGYNRDGRLCQEMLNVFAMHHQQVLTNLEKGEVIAMEPIYPHRYISSEPLAKVNWTLADDTLTISGLLCHRATGKLYGKQWTVWYTEEIPTSAGPWKLRGLPGLIVKADDSDGIHCFELYGTKNEVRGINDMDNPNYLKLSRKKLMAFKKKTFGNARYPKAPTYYVSKHADDVMEINWNGDWFYFYNGLVALQKGRVYQPLELE